MVLGPARASSDMTIDLKTDAPSSRSRDYMRAQNKEKHRHLRKVELIVRLVG